MSKEGEPLAHYITGLVRIDVGVNWLLVQSSVCRLAWLSCGMFNYYTLYNLHILYLLTKHVCI